MKISYETQVTLSIENIEAEELTNVLDMVTDRVYDPDLIKIKPEYEYDCEGWPMGPTGTYAVEIKEACGGLVDLDKIIHFAKDHYERLNENFGDLIK